MRWAGTSVTMANFRISFAVVVVQAVLYGTSDGAYPNSLFCSAARCSARFRGANVGLARTELTFANEANEAERQRKYVQRGGKCYFLIEFDLYVVWNNYDAPKPDVSPRNTGRRANASLSRRLKRQSDDWQRFNCKQVCDAEPRFLCIHQCILK